MVLILLLRVSDPQLYNTFVERTFAWLGNFRRLVVHWERHITLYSVFFHLACLLITLRQL
jgi:hypothetical protein